MLTWHPQRCLTRVPTCPPGSHGPPTPPRRDLQLMVDVLTSGGAPGHVCPPGTPPPAVYFSNPDLLWVRGTLTAPP